MNSVEIIIKKKLKIKLSTLAWISYMDLQWVNIYHTDDLNGWKYIDKIKQKLMNIKSNSTTAYILEVDLEYLQELHDIHNDYPSAPQTLT